MPPFSHKFSVLSMAAIFLLASLWSGPALADAACPSPDARLGLTQAGADPEIDRSPIWAVVYGRYLYLLGREMFWPGIERKDRFRIAVVNWPDLAVDLADRLDGRAIAGLPVDIVALDTKELANEKEDFTVLFLGGSADAEALVLLSQSMAKWQRKGDRAALVVTDGGEVEGHDVVFRRMKVAEGLSLCIAPDDGALLSKSLDLPAHFRQRRCP